jgi:putative flavoprotein involved in K+ transport
VSSGGRERVQTVVVGAGQAGLAVGYHLARRGRPAVILDAHPRVGDAWWRRWDSLRLFTPARYNALPGLPCPGPAWSFPTKDEMADFLEEYARRHGLRVRTGVTVERLTVEGDRYVVVCGEQRLEADNVVVASGAFGEPRVPEFAPKLDPAIVQTHAGGYRNPAQLRPGGVLVVGAGNSGADIAVEVARAGHPTLLSGRDTGQETPYRIGSLPDRLLTPVALAMLSRVLTVRTRGGRALRRRTLSTGHPLIRIRPADLAAAGVQRAPRTVEVRDGRPVLADGRVLDVSNVIWCTGSARPCAGSTCRCSTTGCPCRTAGWCRAIPACTSSGCSSCTR